MKSNWRQIFSWIPTKREFKVGDRVKSLKHESLAFNGQYEGHIYVGSLGTITGDIISHDVDSYFSDAIDAAMVAWDGIGNPYISDDYTLIGWVTDVREMQHV